MEILRYFIKTVLIICLFLSVTQVVQADGGFEGYLDTLKEDALVQSNQLHLRGWALHPDGIERINIYLDDQLAGEASYGITREDVASAYPSIRESDKSGFDMELDLSKVKDGNHLVTIEGFTKSYVKGIVLKTKFVKSDPLKGAIEEPLTDFTVVKGNHIDVYGWASSIKSIKSIQIWLDGHFIEDAQTGIVRQDIIQMYSDVQQNSGYQYTLDISKVYKGTHTIQVIAEFDDGSTSEVGEKTFKKQFNYPMLILLIILGLGALFIYNVKKKKRER